jgi:hypothetical protein
LVYRVDEGGETVFIACGGQADDTNRMAAAIAAMTNKQSKGEKRK